MKKLVLKNPPIAAPETKQVQVEKVHATCDWCGDSKECIRSPRAVEVERHDTESVQVVVGRPEYRESMFDGGKPYRIRDYDYGRVVKHTRTEKVNNFDICHDCGKQVAELLK